MTSAPADEVERLAYWRERLRGASIVELPADRARSVKERRERRRLPLPLSPALSAGLRVLASNELTTTATVLAAAWATLLARFARQEDVVVGVREGDAPDPWALRLAFPAALTVRALIAETRDAARDAHRHAIGLETLVSEITGQNGVASLPFSIALVEGKAAALDVDVVLAAQDRDSGVLVTLDYDAALFDDASIGRMAKHLATLLASFVAGPDQLLRRASMLDEDDERTLVALSRGTVVERPFVRIDALVREQAARIPDHPAVEYRGRVVTYGELVERANRLASWLDRRLPGQPSVVGLWLDRSIEMVIAQLAVWTAGHAWVPLDPKTPPDRAARMLADSNAALLLCAPETSALAASLPSGCEIVDLEGLASVLEAERTSAPYRSVRPEDLAYIIFTSGSTGTPKGVQLQHAGLTNLILNNRHQLEYMPDDRVTQMGSCAFDSAIEQIWSPLTNGATSVFVEEELLLSPPDLFRWFRDQRLTRAGMPSSLFEACLEEDWSGTKLRRVGTGLDKLHKFDKPLPFLMGHGYGPTECTIASSRVIGIKELPPPIGRPLQNIRMYVLDDDLGLLPQGALGEGYIAGICVARGYLRADLTAERFLPDPYGPPGARMYRTGDVLRLRSDGNFEFRGRADRQVKVRGYRVEPGEIESVLRAQPDVREAVVVASGDASGSQRLVAYVVSREPKTSADLSELRTRLEALLPAFMIPSAFVAIERIPLTSTGKVDHSALPKPADAAREYVPPSTPFECAIAEVWQEVLGVARVGATDHFFELGGHSLLGSRVAVRLRKRLGIEVAVRALFDTPVLAELAAELARSGSAERFEELPLVRVDRSSPMPLSFAEQRMCFLDDYAPGTSTYNVPDVARLSGRLDERALERALTALVERHEGLRTRFVAVNDTTQRVIDPPRPHVLARLSIEAASSQEREARLRLVIREVVQRPFDLAEGPLFRATLVRLGDEDHALILVSHHTVMDGWSTEIVREELGTLYDAFTRDAEPSLAPLPYQFADHAAWEQDPRRIAQTAAHLSYWTQQLQDVPNLELYADRPRPPVQSHVGADHHFVLDERITQGLLALARRERCSLFMVILGGFAALLSRYSRQTDFAIGTPVGARGRVEVERVVGFFANTLVIRTDLGRNPTVSELLARVRETTLSAYAHQDVPLEHLVNELELPRDTSRTPLFQAFFAMNNVSGAAAPQAGLQARWGVPLDRDTAMFDLTLFANESRGRTPMRFEYSTALFDAATIARMAEHLTTLLASMIEAPDRALGSLPLLTSDELQRATADLGTTVIDYPRSATVPGLFEEQVARTPDAAAVVCGARTLTYRELDRRADAVAKRMRDAGVGPETLVGICLHRTPALVIAALAVMKAGAAYVPLDPQYPRDRLAFMVKDSGLRGVLTEPSAEAALPEGEGARWYVDADEPLDGGGASSPHASARADGAAYVLYTSGSTGQPKGVQVTHRSVVNFLTSMRQLTRFEPADVLLAVTSLSFDIAGLELYLPLVNGARIVLADRDTVIDGHALWKMVQDTGVTFIQATPSTWRLLLEAGLSRKHGVRALCGGEALPVPLARQLAAATTSAWNVYGPTETTIWSTIWAIPEQPTEVMIGTSIGNTQVYVLDPFMVPVPEGVVGEMFIGGDGLARGYLGRPSLTGDRFVPDPFGAPGRRLYRTGDIGRRRRSGELEYLGRVDHQVKVRGFRIELGEIEAVIAAHAGVKQAIVTVHGSEDKRIVAYVVADTEVEQSHQQELDKEQLAGWEATWELHYGEGAAVADPTFNLAGWNSSYTRAALPPEEMREWRDNTIAWVRSRAPKRVLEIGVGTGMILFGVAPATKSYWGFDLSQHALRYIERNLEVLGPKRPEVKLFHRGGEQLAEIGTGERDAIVINSVSQYFPSIEYLTELLTHAARVCGPGGTIRIGDVRSATLVEAFHASIQLFRADDATTTAELADAVRRAVRLEKELVVDPRFFHALRRQIPAIGRVEIEPKRGRYDNEMSRFRYDVTLHLGEGAPPAAPSSFERLAWTDLRGPLREVLAKGTPRVLAVTGVPNARVEVHAALVEALRSDTAPDTVKGLRDVLARHPLVGLHPDDLRALGAELSCRVDLSWGSGGARGEIDVVFTPIGPGAARTAESVLAALAGEPSQLPLSRFANRPVQESLERTLVPRVQSFLKERLPEYMMPSAFVMLDALPLTPNGKVDRKALPAPDYAANASAEHVPPRDDLERQLCDVFAAILGASRVGIHDNFFELGGHSLLASRLMARIAADVGSALGVRVIFEAPTVAELASRLRSAATDGGPALERLVHDGPVPLSCHQAMFWHWEQRHPGTSKWNQFNGVRLLGPLDAPVFAQAVDDVFRRHAALRTSFTVVDGQPMQVIGPASGGWLEHIDVASENQEISEAKAREELAKLMEPSDLRRERIARTLLLRVSREEHWFATALHRILLDGMLGSEFLDEVHRTYLALAAGRPAPAEPDIQYADYAVWQRKCLATDSVRDRLARYKRHFEGAQPLALPFDRPPPARAAGDKLVGPVPATEPSERGLNQRAPCPVLPATWAAVDALAAKESTTSFVVASALYKAFLARVTGQADIVIITPTELSRSASPQLSKVFGSFLDFFVLRTDLSGRPTLREVVQRERAVVAEALANGDLPGSLLLDEECPWDSPLAVSMNFIVEDAPGGGAPPAGDLRVAPLAARIARKAWPRVARLGWFVQNGASELNGAPDLYDAATIADLAARFATFLAESVANPDVPIVG